MATTNIQSFSGDVEVASNLTVDTTTLHVDSVSSRVGIGKTDPSVPCDISGDTKISSNLTVDTTTLHVDSVANRVGIGKTNPSVPCDISGDTKISSNLTVDTTTLHVDSVANRVGIGKTNPGYTMDVNGIVNATNLYIGGSALSSSPWSTVTDGIEYTSGDVFLGENGRVMFDKYSVSVNFAGYSVIATFPANARLWGSKMRVVTSPNTITTSPSLLPALSHASIWYFGYRTSPTSYGSNYYYGDDRFGGYVEFNTNNANRQMSIRWRHAGQANQNSITFDVEELERFSLY